MGIVGSRPQPSGACVQHLPSLPSWFPLKLAKRNILIYPWCTLLNSIASSWKRRATEISGKLNVPTPWDVASYFSVNGAHDTIPGWQTPHVHVGGEKTSSLHCLRLPAQWLGCVATKDLSQVWKATMVVFCQCGRLLPWLSIEKDRIAQIQMGQKELKSSAPAFTSKLGALCQHTAAGWSDPVHGTLVCHRPQASLCFMCQLLFGDLTWFIHEQKPTKAK